MDSPPPNRLLGLDPRTLAQFAEALQEAALPAVWTRGLNLSRGTPPLFEGEREPGEFRFRFPVTDRPVHPQVTLWIDDGDSHCDCGDRNDPCPHIVAVVAALKAGRVQGPTSSPSSSSTSRTLEYRLLRAPTGGLRLERWIVERGPHGEKTSPLGRESLVGRIAGIQSGRIAEPPLTATQADLRVDQALTQAQQLPERPLAPQLWPRIFQGLEEIERVLLDATPIRVSSRTLARTLTLRDAGPEPQAGFVFAIETELEQAELIAPGVAIQPSKQTLFALQELEVSERDRQALRLGQTLPFAQRFALVTELLPSLEERIPVRIETRRLPEALRVSPQPLLSLERRPDGALAVLASVVYYDPQSTSASQETLAMVQDDGSLLQFAQTRLPIRDRAAEHTVARKLQTELYLRLGKVTEFRGAEAVAFLKRAETGTYSVTGSAAKDFHATFHLQPRFLPKGPHTAPTLHFQTGDGPSLEASAASVLQAWRAGERFFQLEDGSWASLPTDWLARFGERASRLLLAREAAGQGPARAHGAPAWLELETARLADDSGAEVAGWESNETLHRLRRALEEPSPDTELPPLPAPQRESLQAELRSYQETGVRWLHWHLQAGSGALLADDMGLGKTLQTLAALPAAVDGTASLVVCPTSVLPAWVREIQKFRPGLRVHVYAGPSRTLPPEPVDVVLTSYALLRLDAQALTGRSWKVAVLDEAQTIKNPDSQVSQAAAALKAEARIALSGTPVENRVEDLWSVFRFLNPGLLGARRNLPGPEAPAAAYTELRTAVRPFILRRLKKEVARELPAKTEAVLYGELNPEERALYQSILAASRAEVLKLLSDGGSPLQALEMLLRLRQACCHPALVPGGIAASAPPLSSSKLALLLETLQTAIEGQHRTLVFSQWTSLLDLVAAELRAREIAFLRIDGSTRDRGRIVEAFQSPTGPPVLLLSLKAGGVGLTLTAADHVVLLDPWWNPSVEDQAADRAHRIGQENPVLIHRLVMRETIEERILELQTRKRAVVEAILSRDSNEAPAGAVPGGASLTRDDLLRLIELPQELRS